MSVSSDYTFEHEGGNAHAVNFAVALSGGASPIGATIGYELSHDFTGKTNSHTIDAGLFYMYRHEFNIGFMFQTHFLGVAGIKIYNAMFGMIFYQ